jgi:2-polyprenyl-3-methyl-5-hydroxy-6-metoxy-1,4-benzoquinol methylase
VDAIEPAADWFDGFFEATWLDEIALHAPVERTEQQVAFLLEHLAGSPGRRLLDLACGHGRIALPLARSGWQVTGLDLSERSLAIASEASESKGLQIDWVLGDMREPPPGPFDAAINVFTAFGYFEDEAENQRVLNAVAAVLVSGGLFLIDTINLLNLVKRYRDRSWEWTETGAIFLQEHQFDALAGRNLARWTFVREDGSRSEILHSVRTYTPHELAVMLEQAGLEITGSWGDFQGGELGFDSPRVILLARKS